MSRAERKRIFLRHVLTGIDLSGVIPAITVGAIMTPRPFTVSSNCSAPKLVKLFHDKQFRHFLVADNGRLAGIISDRDVIPYFGANGGSDEFAGVTAADLMSTDLITVVSSTPVGEAIKQMVQAGINSLPVVDRGVVVGIVTSTDLFLTLEHLLCSSVPAEALA